MCVLRQLEARLEQLARPTAAPATYRRVVGSFLREELRRLSGMSGNGSKQ